VATLPLCYTIHQPDSLADEYGKLNLHAGLAARLYLHRGVFVMVDGGYSLRYFRISRDDTTHSRLIPVGAYFAATLGYML
jgi:hypothetical protein